MSETQANFPAHAVAIVGLAGRFPGAADLDAFWRNLREGVESLDTFSDTDLDAAGVPDAQRSHPHYVRRGTVLENAEWFDAGFFGLSPREAQILDPQQRIFLECAWEALEHAGHAPGATDAAVGVYAGASMNTYLLAQILRDPALTAAAGGYQLMLGNDKDFLCTRVSYKLDLRGPSMTIQTACSTSLVAVQVACRALERHECDIALAGGVSVSFPQRGGYLYQEGMILSPDGHCRPFDAQARGTRAGAGCGLVVLKRLADALAAGDTIHAVIRGAAINNDGAGKAGYTAPSVDGQVEVIATAQMLAGVEPRSIGYLEAHGTATPLGDPIEIAALTQVFRESTSDTGFCRLGSLKANIGHLDAAAGVAGLIKAVLTLREREFAPLVNFSKPNPALGLEQSPFVASAYGAAWPSAATPRRAGVSAFGIGGTNAHVVLEEAPPVEMATDATTTPQLLVLSARSAAALDAATERLAAHLDTHPTQRLADVAYTLQAGRRAFAHRRALVVGDAAQAVEALRAPQRPPVQGAVHEGGARSVAFLFSGQGSQFAGMGRELHAAEPAYRAAVDTCAELLRVPLGLDLREILFAPPGDIRINETRYAQPALFTTEYALAMLWQSRGVRPAAMLGHSIGEYVAAHLAGVMSLADALALVAERGRLMQAMPAGGMAAVHLAADELTRRLQTLGRPVEIAAVNAPGLCTIAGPHEALAAVLSQLQATGIDARALHTSHAFHSAMMDPVLRPFVERVGQVALSTPAVPYVSNLTGQWITPQQATSPAYYAEHLRRAVQFEAGVRTLAADKAIHLLEVGPGQTLATLARQVVGQEGLRRVSASMGPLREADAASGQVRQAMLEAAGRLWLAGVSLEWPGFHAMALPRRVPLPTYPFERRRFAVDVEKAAIATNAVPDAGNGPPRPVRAVDGMFVPTWMRDDSLDHAVSRLADHWLVMGSRDGLTDAVLRAVSKAGAQPILVETGAAFESVDAGHFLVRPGNAEDTMALARELRRSARPVRGVLLLWSLIGGETPAQHQLLMQHHAQVALAAGLDCTPANAIRMVIATAGAHAVLDEPVVRPGAATAFGPVLALPGEVPGLSIRLLDLGADPAGLDPEVAAAAMVGEAAAADSENLVARRAGRRWLRRFEQCRLPAPLPGECPLKPGAVVLITGGLGGMGLAIARHLAQRCRARFVLTARSDVPPRAAWDDWLAAHPPEERNAMAIEALRAIEAAGGEVITFVASAEDRSAMAAAIAAGRARWGSIDVVIHAAGIAGTGQLSALKTDADVLSVLAPKAGGLNVLIDLLGQTPLDAVVLMSSINAVLGAPGVADYAAANAVLDSFVDSDKVPPAWRRVLAIDWGAWREVGMAARLDVPAARREVWRAYLQTAIGTSDGLEAFDRLLASTRRRMVVVPYDLNQVLGKSAEASTAPSSAESGKTSAGLPPGEGAGLATASTLPSIDFEAPASDVEVRIAAIWVELLGVERVGAHDDFFALGGHSLLATRVLARIDESLGARLALRDMFEAPTIRALAARVASLGTQETDREEIEF